LVTVVSSNIDPPETKRPAVFESRMAIRVSSAFELSCGATPRPHRPLTAGATLASTRVPVVTRWVVPNVKDANLLVRDDGVVLARELVGVSRGNREACAMTLS